MEEKKRRTMGIEDQREGAWGRGGEGTVVMRRIGGMRRTRRKRKGGELGELRKGGELGEMGVCIGRGTEEWRRTEYCRRGN
jgi:hypothetical protein